MTPLDSTDVPAFVCIGDDLVGTVERNGKLFVARNVDGRPLGRFCVRSEAIAAVFDAADGTTLAAAEPWGRA
jgi:hypothetical protein